MTWDPLTQPVNKLELAGSLSPGICTLRDGAIKNRVDTKAPSGSSGAVTIFHGRELTKLTATLQLHEVQDFAEWEEFRQVVDSPPAGSHPKALAIGHPIADDLGVTAVVVLGRTQLKPGETGDWEVDIFFEEFVAKPIPTRSTPTGSKQKKKPNPEEDELQRRLRAAQLQYEDEARP